MSKLLISENPVIVIPTLAVKIGLNEAIILQQMHYWITSSKHLIEGRKWIFNTYKDWQKQLPFWSESTIKRSIHTLEKQGLLVSGNWNHSKMDKTKWYTIDYERLHLLYEQPSCPSVTEEETSSDSLECSAEETSMNQENHESATDLMSEKQNLVAEVISYLNEKTNSSYKPSTSKTQEWIRTRAKEGFRLEDFKKVIDLKTAEWLKDSHMSKYLRPETLFGSKFESYLNQKSFQKALREEDFDLDD